MPDVRKTELISQLHQITQDTPKSLAATRRDKIETIQAQLNRYLQSLRETSSDDETLKMKTAAVLQVKRVITSLQQFKLKKADIIPSDLVNIIKQWKHGLVSAEPPDPSKCYTIGKGEMKEEVGEKITRLLQTVDNSNRQCYTALDSITCKLVSESEKPIVHGIVERKGESQYEISLHPTIPGRHQLHVKVKGQHIMGSPFPVHTTRCDQTEKFISPLMTIEGVKEPVGIAVNLRGEVVVAEGGRGCVTVFSPREERLQSIGSFDTSDYYNPGGVTVDSKGNIFAVDRINHIQKFTAQGQLVSIDGSGIDESSIDAAFNPSNGRVYVVSADRVKILNSDLKAYGGFGNKGSGQEQFDSPEGIACDSAGNVYVADHGNHRIQVFTAKGKFLRVIRPGVGHGGVDRDKQWWRPMGIAIDSSGRVYVSTWDDYIDVFTAEGQLLKSFGSRGSEPGQFTNPRGLAVDSSGVCYVCDCLNNRIQLFKI